MINVRKLLFANRKYVRTVIVAVLHLREVVLCVHNTMGRQLFGQFLQIIHIVSIAID